MFDVNTLRSGAKTTETIMLAGVPHDPRMLAAADRIDDLEEALYHIRNWCDAYHVDIFPKPTKDEIKVGVDALQATGIITSDRLHASWARHILSGVRRYTDLIDKEPK